MLVYWLLLVARSKTATKAEQLNNIKLYHIVSLPNDEGKNYIKTYKPYMHT